MDEKRVFSRECLVHSSFGVAAVEAEQWPRGAGLFGEDVALSWNNWIRQFHRWVSIAFTVTVIANFVALARGGGTPPAPWVTYSPLLPLALLLYSGLYLCVLPYAVRRRAGRRAES